MRISELITELQAVQIEHGDIQVAFGYYELTSGRDLFWVDQLHYSAPTKCFALKPYAVNGPGITSYKWADKRPVLRFEDPADNY